MNYCTKCGAKLEKKNNFCTECGAKIQKANDFQKPILILGIFLVLFASFLLGVFSWKHLSSIGRILFFAFESLLFYGLSLVLKKLNSKLYKLFFIIGLVLVPYTFSLIPYYGLLPSSMNSGAGLYIYLAIIYFVNSIIFLLVNSFFKNKIVDILTLTLLLLSFGCMSLAIYDSLTFLSLVIIVFTLTIILLSFTSLFKDNFKFAINILSDIVIVAILPFMVGLFFVFRESSDLIINCISLVLYVIIVYIKVLKNDGIKYIIPFILCISIYTYIISALLDFDYTSIYVVLILSLILYVISVLINDKSFKEITLVTSYVTLFAVYIFSLMFIDGYNITFMASIICLIINLENIFIEKYNVFNYILPVTIFLTIFNFVRFFSNVDIYVILLSTSLVYLLFYLLLKAFNNKRSFIFLLGTLILSILSFSNLEKGINIVNVSIIIVLLLIYIFGNLFKERKEFNIVTYIFFNIFVVSIAHYEFVNDYYALLALGSVTLLTSLLLNKFTSNNYKPYILYSEILILIVTLTNNLSYGNVLLFINMLIYSISYLTVIKYYNNNIYRILYLGVGLITLTRIINVLIEPIIVSSIISIVLLIAIILFIYLLEIEDKVNSLFVSLVVLYPYYLLIYNLSLDLPELYLFPIIFYVFFITNIYKFQTEDTKRAITIIPLSFILINYIFMCDGTKSIIIDVITAVIYIFMGLYRKFNILIYLGIAFILITLFIQLFSILHSIAIIILLIILGFILIGIATYFEVKKKD